MVGGAPAAAHGLTIDDVLAMRRVGEPVVSPDGEQVAFAVTDIDMGANKGRSTVWLAASDGSHVMQLTAGPDGDRDPQWSPDGRWLYFSSSRSGSPQVWRISPAGGEAEQVTRLPIGVDGFKVCPDGRHLVIAADVWPEAKSLAASAQRDAELAKSKVLARTYDRLVVRFWDQWEDGKYSHLFVWTSPEAGGTADEARDLTPGFVTDVPRTTEDMQIAPDGKTVAFAAATTGRDDAWHTAFDVFVAAIDGKTKPTDITIDNLANDFGPVFSPDGKSIALHRMERAGDVMDRERIAIYEVATRKLRVVTEGWDRSPDTLTWSADGKTMFADADNLGNHSIFAIDVATGAARVVIDKGYNTAPRVAGDRLMFARDTLKAPAELYSAKRDGSDVRQLTHFNDTRIKAITWGDYEQFTFKGAHGDAVYGYAIKPAGYTAGKVPVALVIHGGPADTMGDRFHYRLNSEVFAGHGYGVIVIDFHGSTGYGQAFSDAVAGNFGDVPYDDLMKGLDAALERYKWLDKSRVVALGPSYGGYMINWINGHTDRFRALVCHDGMFDARMFYFTSDLPYFQEREFGGVPWVNAGGYAKASPSEFVNNWKTPTLVIHGGNDYRIPDSQGLGAFTALQRKGVSSRLLFFPDEGHFVLKPQNSRRWYAEVLAWIDAWSGPR